MAQKKQKQDPSGVLFAGSYGKNLKFYKVFILLGPASA
jgi:hypothetical protein